MEAKLVAEATKPPPRYTEATLLSAMETAGKLVEDEDAADAMKERGLGTPATRADIIDGLIYQKYMDRNQRELVPSAKAEQLIEFLEAVEASDLTSPAMTGEWEYQLREMTRGKFSRQKFMAEIVEETKGIVERVKNFEEDDSIARETDIISPTDRKPLRETLRGYKSQDGEFMIYKVIGGRKMEESEIRELVVKGSVGPLDGFVSAKTRATFAATLKLAKDEKTGKWKAEYDFGDKVDLGSVEPFWKDPATGAELCEVGSNYVLRERENGEWKQAFRVPPPDVQERDLTRRSGAFDRKGKDRSDQRIHFEERPTVRCFPRAQRRQDPLGVSAARSEGWQRWQTCRAESARESRPFKSKGHRRKQAASTANLWNWRTPTTCASRNRTIARCLS